MDIREYLLKIDDEFRPMCYWGWLENLTDDETEWQINEMHKAGLGGYVAHARGGLEVKYMGKEWQSSVLTAVKTGKKNNMLTIMDDEDGWPSGFGGGEVNGRGDFYYQKYLICEEKPAGEIAVTKNTLGVYKKNSENNSIFDVIDINHTLTVETDETLIHIYFETDKYYTDLSDPTVTQAFIDASYEKYKKLCEGELGGGLWGIFSDEPQLARDHMQWSYSLPLEFIKQYDYNIIDNLPHLFYDTPESHKIRNDYYKTTADMFALNYAKKIKKWCDENNIVFTGHTTCEEDFHAQISCTGNTMPFYEYFTVPGIDWLCRIGVSNMLIKQLTSVASQLEKPRVLSEMYGCAGWNISFEEMKWIGEWQIMFGIDLMLQHLGLYSLKGSRKREYPASLFYQQTWWDRYPAFNDYFARLCKLINQSTEQVNVLVIHPIETAYVLKTREHNPEIVKFTQEYKEFLDKLLYSGINFHLGDSVIMQRHSKTDKTTGNKLQIGSHLYDTIIIPECVSISLSTAEILREYADNGGKIISVGDFPVEIDGKRNDSLLDDLKKKAISAKFNELQELCNTKTYIKMQDNTDNSDNSDIYIVTRNINDSQFHMVFNSSKDKIHNFSLAGINNAGINNNVSVLSLEDMSYYKIDLDNITLEPMQSLIITEHSGADKESLPSGTPKKTDEIGAFTIKDVSANSLTIDSCRYSIDGGEIMPAIMVNELQQKLLKGGKNCDVKMIFNFNADYSPENDVFLVMEEPNKCKVTLNGDNLLLNECGYFVDKSFKKIDISNKIKIGVNEIIIERRFENLQKTYDIKNTAGIHEAEFNRTTVQTELEAVYIVGGFKVKFDGDYTPSNNNSFFAKGKFTIIPPDKNNKNIDDVKSFTKNGYPFFAGDITVSAAVNIDKSQGKRIILDITRPDSVLSVVKIGEHEHIFMWAPYRYDITELVNNGENEISVTLYTSNRNLLGPLHNNEGESYGVGPHTFIHNQNPDIDAYAFVNFGLSGGASIAYYD